MQYIGRTSTSLDDLSLPNVDFSSEAGEVLMFLLTFCIKTKSKSGFGAEAPLSELAKVEFITTKTFKPFEALLNENSSEILIFISTQQISRSSPVWVNKTWKESVSRSDSVTVPFRTSSKTTTDQNRKDSLRTPISPVSPHPNSSSTQWEDVKD